jgi:hypothetical protein
MNENTVSHTCGISNDKIEQIQDLNKSIIQN